MFKIIYAEARLPALSFVGFVRRWRLHAARAMEDSVFWDPMAVYLQNDAVLGIDGTDPYYDCVGELIYPTLAAVEASLATPGLDEILADGDGCFARTGQIHMVVEEHAVRTGNPGAFKVFVFAAAPSGTSRAAFVASWTDRVGTLLGGTGDFARLAQTVTIGSATALDTRYDLVADATFATMVDARQGCADWFGAMRADPLIVDHVAIAARSYLMYDAQYTRGDEAA